MGIRLKGWAAAAMNNANLLTVARASQPNLVRPPEINGRFDKPNTTWLIQGPIYFLNLLILDLQSLIKKDYKKCDSIEIIGQINKIYEIGQSNKVTLVFRKWFKVKGIKGTKALKSVQLFKTEIFVVVDILASW